MQSDIMMSIVSYLLIMCLMVCECYSKADTYTKEDAFADLMCPDNQIGFTTVTRSAVSCVRSCDITPGCRSLVYLHSNKTCFGVTSYTPFDASSPLPGAVFYRPSRWSFSTTTTNTTTTPTPTTTTFGPGTPMAEGASDAQFTASSYDGDWFPWNARLSSVSFWSPTSSNLDQWIQIDFLTQILATHVITRGSPTHFHWVTSYKVLTSTDCANFAAVTDNIGNDMVFTGNVDRDTDVTNALESHVTCRCLRINPRTWEVWIDLRFEVLGHVL